MHIYEGKIGQKKCVQKCDVTLLIYNIVFIIRIIPDYAYGCGLV